eukprot:SAG31_NODE_39987_length_284_cov_0.767568_1_plen_39_part_10
MFSRSIYFFLKKKIPIPCHLDYTPTTQRPKLFVGCKRRI